MRPPLSRQTEFKRIKNVVVEEAWRLGEHTEVFTPADTQKPLQASEDTSLEPEVESESSDVLEEALGGNALAIHDLGRKIGEKKIAMGRKPDDHEEPVQQLR